MNLRPENVVRLVVAGACLLVVGWGTHSSAQEESSLLLSQPTDEVTLPPYREATPEAQVLAAPMAAECCPALCISYRTHPRARRMLRCQDQVEIVMAVDNPADCDSCLVEVPLCLPCCCTDEPTVTSDCGHFGRGSVEYCWSCGYRATVVFRARGDVVVHYGA